jgi:hypothetical protein
MFLDTSSRLSSFTGLGIDTLHIRDTVASPVGTPTPHCDTGSVALGTNCKIQVSDSEVMKVVREGDHENLNPDKPLDKFTSLPFNERPQFVSDLSQPDVPPRNVLELSHLALAAEDASSQGSFMSGTDSDSDGKWQAGRALGIARQVSEEQDLTAFPSFDSKWMANFTNHTGHQASASASATSSKSAKHSASASSSSNNSSKRGVDSYGDYPADGDDDLPERTRLDPSTPEDLGNSVKLACPFLKHDPRKYNPIDYHTCATTPWNTIKLLK